MSDDRCTMSYSIGRFTAGLNDAFWIPRRARTDLPLVVYLHGASGQASSAVGQTVPSIAPILRAIARAGYAIVAPSTGDSWGNAVGDSRITDAITWGRANLGCSTDPPILIGHSMGATNVLDYAADHPCRCLIALLPPVDLQAIVAADTGSLRAGINSAWARGAADVSTLPGSSAALLLPGTSGAYASAPDSAALSITTNLDLRWWGAPVGDDWSPAVEMGLVSKWNATGNQRSYILSLLATGKMRFYLSADGTSTTPATQTIDSSAAVAASGVVAVRVTYRASDRRVQFFTSTDGTTFTQLGTDVTHAATTIFDGTADLIISGWSLGTAQPFTGKATRAQVRNNILDDGTGIVYDADFTTATPGVASIVESSSNAATVTVKGTARIDKNADPALQTTPLAQVAQQLWYATDDNVSANIGAYATAVGADLRPVGALGHTDAAIAAASIPDIVAFIHRRARRRIAA